MILEEPPADVHTAFQGLAPSSQAGDTACAGRGPARSSSGRARQTPCRRPQVPSPPSESRDASASVSQTPCPPADPGQSLGVLVPDGPVVLVYGKQSSRLPGPTPATFSQPAPTLPAAPSSPTTPTPRLCLPAHPRPASQAGFAVHRVGLSVWRGGQGRAGQPHTQGPPGSWGYMRRDAHTAGAGGKEGGRERHKWGAALGPLAHLIREPPQAAATAPTEQRTQTGSVTRPDCTAA